MSFSQKTLITFDIAIDTRENALNPFFRDYLLSKNLRVIITKLDEGDFYVTSKNKSVKGVIVERKTWDDFVNSIIDKRVWSQANRLKEIAKTNAIKTYIVIEGDPIDIKEKREISFNAVLAVLDSLQNHYGITILFVPDKQVLADWLIHLSLKLSEEAKETRVRETVIVQRPIKKLTVDDKIRAVLQVLAGPIIGDRLIKKFGSLRNIANASISELMTIDGIGENRAKELYFIFNKKLGE